MRQRHAKHCHWEIIIIIWTEYISLPATPPSRIKLHTFCTNGHGAYSFVPATLPVCVLSYCVQMPLAVSGQPRDLTCTVCVTTGK